jgi:RNA polymerase sigma-70 factor, ECF subfamily
MAYQRAIDRRRYLAVRHHYSVQEFDEELSATTRGQISIDHVAGTVLLDRLRREISTEQRQTLELHLFEGYSFREIAAKTGQTFGNIRNHYYRGLERLRSYVFPKE